MFLDQIKNSRGRACAYSPFVPVRHHTNGYVIRGVVSRPHAYGVSLKDNNSTKVTSVFGIVRARIVFYLGERYSCLSEAIIILAKPRGFA